ncbi:hypothetical protein ACLB2K_038766 [Fragaria x ananassa]
MGWQGRLLSMAGRTQLVQSVFQSMLLHSFSKYHWPVYLVKKLTSWARNFIWSGNIGTRKIVTIRWAQVCAPKLEGGLGIRDLSSLNSAAILKFAWDSFSSHSQWGDYVRPSNLHVADFISHQSWQLPPFFCQAFPLLARQISDLALPLIDESDMLIWEPSTSDFWKSYCQKPFSSQLFNLWLAAGMFTFMALWKARNKLRFDNRTPNFYTMCCSIMAWIREISLFAPGHYKGVLDARLLASLGVAPKGGKAPRIQHVLWQPPFFPWIKVNTDGLAKGNPGPAACGGVFRDASACFSSRSFSPPWNLRVRWNNCLSIIRQMNFRCSHIFREGNMVADKMANLGLSNASFTWYDNPPTELHGFLQADYLGIPNYRFS